ncbi:MAG TPA: hypothetical protein DCX17_04480 [Firmicutes bacterium]|nr:hypothetical protein [Bacillota bacterium]
MINLVSNNLYWYIGVSLGVVILLVLIIIFIKRPIKKKAAIPIDAYLRALGGINNIVGVRASGSRLSLNIENGQLIDTEELKKLGVGSTVIMSQKVILLIGQEASSIAHLIDGLIKK